MYPPPTGLIFFAYGFGSVTRPRPHNNNTPGPTRSASIKSRPGVIGLCPACHYPPGKGRDGARMPGQYPTPCLALSAGATATQTEEGARMPDPKPQEQGRPLERCTMYSTKLFVIIGLAPSMVKALIKGTHTNRYYTIVTLNATMHVKSKFNMLQQ